MLRNIFTPRRIKTSEGDVKGDSAWREGRSGSGNVAISKTARNVDAVYEFMNFVMEPEIMARIVNDVHYAAANQAALPLIDEAIRNDPAIYPPKEVLDRCELIEDLGETTPLIDELWTEIKAR